MARASVSRKRQGLIERHWWRDDTLDAHGVELLEFLQLPRLRRGAEAAECRQWDELVVRAGDVHPWKLIRGQALGALDLRDDFVAPALDAEAVHVVATEQRRQVLARLTEIDALRAELVAVEDDFGLWLIELHVRVGKDEQPARERLRHELVRQVAQPLRLGRRGDHQVHWEVAAAGQRRRGQRDRANTGNLRQRPGRPPSAVARSSSSARSTAWSQSHQSRPSET